MEISEFRDLLANDGFAATFQTMGKYRTELLRAFDKLRAQADARPFGYKSFDDWCEEIIADGGHTVRSWIEGQDPMQSAREAWEVGRYQLTHPEASAPGLSDDGEVACSSCGLTMAQSRALTRASAATVAEPSDSAKIIDALWSIIDDIDTYDDAAKGDDALYRKLVQARQKDRWKTGITTDGYGLKMPQAAQQQAEPVKVYPQGVMGIPPYDPRASGSHQATQGLTWNAQQAEPGADERAAEIGFQTTIEDDPDRCTHVMLHGRRWYREDHPKCAAQSGQRAGVAEGNETFRAVIAFVLRNGIDGIEFLRCWNEGDFTACRKEWPEAPDACYIGADPMAAAPTQQQEGGK